MARSRIGIWLVGAHGSVAATAVIGLVALKKGLVGNQGLVSTLPQFADAGLAPWKDFIAVGGHEIRRTTLYEEATELCRTSRIIGDRILARCKSRLAAIDANVRPGTLLNVGPTIQKLAVATLRRKRETPRAAVERLQADLQTFRTKHRLDRLVVVNLASTEPPIDATGLPERWADLARLLDKPRRCPLPASSLYAIAALDRGHTYINFTPSLGSAPKAICELAQERGAAHMGCDGKTGETLLKSVLGPMFARRNLEVMSWAGYNIFGNRDSQVLRDPANKKTKVTSKDRLLRRILGYSPQTLVGIEHVASLGDWKTAWDHIHFKGFLGTPMAMQFTWQGSDSVLAAPLVLDLVRLAERAARRGEAGLLTFLASFFKSPLGITEHDFTRQFVLLEDWARSAGRP